MVTTPQEVALLDVRKAMALFNQVNVPILGVIENMSYYQSSDQVEPIYLFGRGGGQRLAKEAGTPFLGQIPLDPMICSCGDQGQSLFQIDPNFDRSATKAFIQVAKEVELQISSLDVEKQKGLGPFELIWKEMTP